MKRKAHVVLFDENSRREFVTGFHKRKLARKKKATEEFEKQLKEAKRKIKEQARKTYGKMIHPIKAVPDEREVNENEYELPEHIVKVKELLPEDIAEQNNWIGQNRMRIDNNDDTDVENSTLATEVDDSVPGMTATSLKEVRKIVNNQASASMQNDKIFRKKNKLEKLKNRKKAARKRNLLKREQKKLKGRRRK